MLKTFLLTVAAVGIAAGWFTGLLRRYALARSLLDMPGARSSHSVPTPRGGGVAIVVAFLLGLVTLRGAGALQDAVVIALAGAGALVALVGFIDDHRHLAARWRLLAHFVAVLWLLYWLTGMQSPVPVDLPWLPQWAITALLAIYLVWLVNLYNFMDGIDGIAGAEAMTVAVTAAGLYGLAGVSALAGIVPGLLAAAAAGFLVWNFPRARIFMGDAGSGFLGLMLGGCAVLAALQAPALFWAWQILLGVFVVDATVTLLRRVLRGERFYEAHRSHAYQHAARRAGSHRPVTLAVVAIDVLWLLPMAALVAAGRLEPLYGIAVAYAPLIALALYYNAGRQEE